MQIYASLPIYIIIQRTIYEEKQFFFMSLAGIELATAGSAVQYLILPYLTLSPIPYYGNTPRSSIAKINI